MEKKFINEGKWLKGVRAKLKMTQTQLGREFDVCGQTISNAERGLAGLPVEDLQKLVKKYDLQSTKAQFLSAISLDNHQRAKTKAEMIYRKKSA